MPQIDEYDLFPCNGCGRVFPLRLLDAKPNDPAHPDACDWEVFECEECYGPGWAEGVDP